MSRSKTNETTTKKTSKKGATGKAKARASAGVVQDPTKRNVRRRGRHERLASGEHSEIPNHKDLESADASLRGNLSRSKGEDGREKKMKPPPRKALLPPPRRPVEKKSEPQEHLFYMPESWEREWKGMPGYVQSDLEPHKRLQVNFATIDDLMAFAKHIGQQVTMKTVSIWYPKVEFDKVSELRWVDGNGSGGPKYHEWKKKGSKDYYDCPRKLDPDTEKKVLAYEDFMHLLEKQ